MQDASPTVCFPCPSSPEPAAACTSPQPPRHRPQPLTAPLAPLHHQTGLPGTASWPGHRGPWRCLLAGDLNQVPGFLRHRMHWCPGRPQGRGEPRGGRRPGSAAWWPSRQPFKTGNTAMDTKHNIKETVNSQGWRSGEESMNGQWWASRPQFQKGSTAMGDPAIDVPQQTQPSSAPNGREPSSPDQSFNPKHNHQKNDA